MNPQRYFPGTKPEADDIIASMLGLRLEIVRKARDEWAKGRGR